MSKIIRIGMDTSKSVFVLHGVNAAEQPVLRRKLRRSQVLEFFRKLEPTEVGLEACGGAHHWAREISALGHKARLVPAQYAKKYVHRNKNDPADAEAVCEAMSRPRIRRRFVPVKTVEQQAALMLAGTRDGLIRRRTQLSNTMRGHAAEFGIVAGKGLGHIKPLLARISSAAEAEVPMLAKELFALLAAEFEQVDAEIGKLERMLKVWHKGNETSRRLAEIDGIGPIGASSAVMKTPDPHVFRSARDYAAWIGLTPKDHSSGPRKRLGGITRAGDETLRSLLICGATAVVNQVRQGKGNPSPWLLDLVRRKPPKLAAVALANKNARIAWKLMVSGERYDRTRCGRSRSNANVAPTACTVTACSPPSRPLRAAAGGGLRPALTAAAPAVAPQLQVGTKKRLSGRTKKPGQKLHETAAMVEG